MCEVGLITPPVGLNVYVVKGVLPHVPLEEIFAGVMPFVVMNIIVLGLLLLFPDIALFLPNMMRR